MCSVHSIASTTGIYAKLDLAALSQVALPWPGGSTMNKDDLQLQPRFLLGHQERRSDPECTSASFS